MKSHTPSAAEAMPFRPQHESSSKGIAAHAAMCPFCRRFNPSLNDDFLHLGCLHLETLSLSQVDKIPRSGRLVLRFGLLDGLRLVILILDRASFAAS